MNNDRHTNDKSMMAALGISPEDIGTLRYVEVNPAHFHPLGGILWVSEHIGMTWSGVEVGVYGRRVMVDQNPTYDEAMEAWKSSSSN